MFTTGSRHRQRYGQLLLLVILFVGSLATLWLFPTPVNDRHGTQTGTRFGVLGQSRIDHRYEHDDQLQYGNATLGAIAVGITIVLVPWFLFAAYQIIGNTSPRDRCRHCGHHQPDDPTSLSNLCPICDRLPNEYRAPWAFWRR